MRFLVALILMMLPFPSLAVSSSGCTQRSPKRSAAVVREFRKANPCPATGKTRGACHGFQIDHIRPLCCGGKDGPSNMHWLSVADHKAKHAYGIACNVGP
jgi:hypothetical protein